METFWFLQLRFHQDSAYDSDFRFSPGHKRSYDSDYDSDYNSVAGEKWGGERLSERANEGGYYIDALP